MVTKLLSTRGVGFLCVMAIAAVVMAGGAESSPRTRTVILEEESMIEEVTIEALPSADLVQDSGDPLVRVTVSSSCFRVGATSSTTRSYGVFPDFFAELLGASSDGIAVDNSKNATLSVLPLKELGLDFCSGRWQPEWGTDDNSASCRGHTLSAVFKQQLFNAHGNNAGGLSGSSIRKAADRHLPCKSWLRVLNALGATFSTSYSQAHPLACEVSEARSPFDGTTTATLAPVHKRHVYSSSDWNEKAIAEQELQRHTTPRIAGSIASDYSDGEKEGAVDGGGGAVAYFTGIPLESFCSDSLAPLMKMLPGLFWMQKSHRRDEVERRPKGVWSRFVPHARVLFAQPFVRMNTQLRSSSSSAAVELSVSLQFIIPQSKYLKDVGSYPKWAAASDFSARSTLDVVVASPGVENNNNDGGNGSMKTTSINLKEVTSSSEGAASRDLAIEIASLLSAGRRGATINEAGESATVSAPLKQFGSSQAYVHCGVIKQFLVQQRGEVDGRLKLVVQMPPSFPFARDEQDGSSSGDGSSISADKVLFLRLVLPLHIVRPLIHTLNVVVAPQPTTTATPSSTPIPTSSPSAAATTTATLMRVAKDLKANTVTVLIKVSHRSSGNFGAKGGAKEDEVVLAMKYLVPFVNVNHYPPDANKAYWIPAAVAFYAPGELNACGCRQEHPHRTGLSELLVDDLRGSNEEAQSFSTNWCVESSQDATVISLPIPDVSMPFNVLAVACGMFAVFYGSIFAMTARNIL